MPSKSFTLKDNPIFQNTEIPVRKAPPADPEADVAAKMLPFPVTVAESTQVENTQVKNTVAESTQVENTIVKSTEVISPPEPSAETPARNAAKAIPASAHKTTTKPTATVEEEHAPSTVHIVSNYYHMDSDISDHLARVQTPIEHMVYQRMYRLSYGFQRTICTVSIRKLKDHLNIGSDKTVQLALAGLTKNGHIRAIGGAGHNPKGNVYEVFLPKDIPNAMNTESKTRTESSVVKNTIVQSTTAPNEATSSDTATGTPCILEGFFESLSPGVLDELVTSHGHGKVQQALDVLNIQWARSTPPKSPIAVLKTVLNKGIELPDGFVSREEQKRRSEEGQQRLQSQQREEQEREDEASRLRAIRDALTDDEREALRTRAEQRIRERLKIGPGDLGYTKMLVKAHEDDLLRDQVANT